MLLPYGFNVCREVCFRRIYVFTEAFESNRDSHPMSNTRVVPFCPLLLCVWIFFVPFQSQAGSGDWTTFRGNLQRTGHSALQADIEHPAIAWRYNIQEWTAGLDIGPNTESSRFFFEYKPRGPRPRPIVSQYVELLENSKNLPFERTNNLLYDQFLPDVPYSQKFCFEDGMAIKTKPDGPHRPVAQGRLYRADHGKEEIVWTTEPEEQCEMPLCVVADMNGDGIKEIVVATWYRVMVFDSQTGEKIDECRWHKGRNYGHFEVRDLNGDGLPECIVLADFMIHMNVLENQQGKLALKWRKPVEFQLFGKRKSLRLLPAPIVDTDGDGVLELVVNLYNDTGDERWHVMVYDAFTGEVKEDLPGKFVSGLEDLNQDSACELLLTPTQGLALQKYGPLYIGSLQNESIALYEIPLKARWILQERPLTQTYATVAADGRKTVLTSTDPGTSQTAFWIAQAPSIDENESAGETITALIWKGGTQFETAFNCTLPNNGEVSFQCFCEGTSGPNLYFNAIFKETPHYLIPIKGGAGRLVNLKPLSMPPDVPIAFQTAPNSAPLICISSRSGTIHAIEPPHDGEDTPRLRWSRPGRSQTGDMGTFYGLEAADLDGDRLPEILAAVQEDDGTPALIAYKADGSTLYRHRFNRFPGGPPRWNTGGLLRWTYGRFTTDNAYDVYVCLRRTVMHTDESCLLAGPDAREVWWNDDVLERGCGGLTAAVADIDADKRDELVMQYPDLHFSLDGVSGEILNATPWPHQELGGWSAYAQPLLADADRDGKLEVYSGNCRYTFARWTLDGHLEWHTPYLDGSNALPALADLDGDGNMELCGPASAGGLRCYDPRSGELRWTWQTERALTDVLAIDIDHDGKDELVFGEDRRIVALKELGGVPMVLWSLNNDSTVYSPIAADTDADGLAEILYLTANDGLICIDTKQ